MMITMMFAYMFRIVRGLLSANQENKAARSSNPLTDFDQRE